MIFTVQRGEFLRHARFEYGQTARAVCLAAYLPDYIPACLAACPIAYWPRGITLHAACRLLFAHLETLPTLLTTTAQTSITAGERLARQRLHGLQVVGADFGAASPILFLERRS